MNYDVLFELLIAHAALVDNLRLTPIIFSKHSELIEHISIMAQSDARMVMLYVPPRPMQHIYIPRHIMSANTF